MSLAFDFTEAYARPEPPHTQSLKLIFSGPLVAPAWGCDSSAFGSPQVANAAQAFYPQGIDAAGFGAHLVWHAEINGGNLYLDLVGPEGGGNYTPPPASIQFLFGLQIQSILPTGDDFLGLGTPEVVNVAQGIFQQGDDFARIGKVRVIQDRGPDKPYFYTFDFYGNYTPPPGDDVFIEWGSGNQTISPAGINGLQFGTATLVNVAQGIFAEGLHSLEFGTLSMDSGPAAIRPNGSSFASFGTLSIINIDRFISVSGASFAAVGTPQVALKTRYVLPAGSDFSAFGTTQFQLFNRQIYPTGVSGAAFGTPSVANTALNIRPTGIAAPGIGSPWIAPSVRFISAVGAIAPLALGSPIVWPRVRPVQLAPGIDTLTFGKPWAKYPDDAKLCNYSLLLTL